MGSIGIKEIVDHHQEFLPIFRSAASDLNTTLALTLIVFFTIQFVGIAAIGFIKYAKKFKQHEGVMKLKQMRVDEGFDVVMELVPEEE